MNKETDLSSKWLEAWQLRQWSKGRVAKELGQKMNSLEEALFEEADQNIDNFYARKRRNQPNPTSGKDSA
jgi:hypothetical protein